MPKTNTLRGRNKEGTEGRGGGWAHPQQKEQCKGRGRHTIHPAVVKPFKRGHIEPEAGHKIDEDGTRIRQVEDEQHSNVHKLEGVRVVVACEG